MKKYWFYLEPYSFIWRFNKKGLVYNSISYQSIEFDNIGILKEKMDQISDVQNMYCIEVLENEILNNNLRHFILHLQNTFSGGLIKFDSSYYKPVFIPPKLKLMPSIYDSNGNYSESAGNNIKSYLSEVNLYVNGTCNQNCIGCNRYYKQVPFCTKSKDELSLNHIANFLFQISDNYLKIINILGGNIFKYGKINELYKLLSSFSNVKVFHVNYKNVLDGPTFIEKFINDKNRLKISVDFTYLNASPNLEFILKEKQSYIDYIFVVTSNEEFKSALKLIEKYKIEKYNITPIFTGRNNQFFKENVFLTKDDIVQTTLNKRQIFLKEVLNTYDFGKITILSDNKIYANLNQQPIGNILTPVNELLYKEITEGLSWRRTRMNFEPCNTCVYQFLCPSPSNYEIILNKHNLCDINL